MAGGRLAALELREGVGLMAMRVRKMRTLNPFLRWRWEAAGMFGYTSTRRAAASAARAALLASQGGAR